MRTGPRGSIAAALEADDVVWLSSVRPDGRPHVVPVWFLWDGQALVMYSKPNAQKVRNIRANPRVMVAVGQPADTFDVELIDGLAELIARPRPGRLPRPFLAKYAERASRAGVSLDGFAALYSQPIRIRPTRWLGWGGPGNDQPRTTMASRTATVSATSAVIAATRSQPEVTTPFRRR